VTRSARRRRARVANFFGQWKAKQRKRYFYIKFAFDEKTGKVVVRSDDDDEILKGYDVTFGNYCDGFGNRRNWLFRGHEDLCGGTLEKEPYPYYAHKLAA
jgi:hypothetical protein